MALFKENKEEKIGYDYRIQDVRDYIDIAEYCNKNFDSSINWQILDNGNLLITQTDEKSTGLCLSFNCLNELNKIRIIQVVSAKDSLTYDIFFDNDSVSKKIAEFKGTFKKIFDADHDGIKIVQRAKDKKNVMIV